MYPADKLSTKLSSGWVLPSVAACAVLAYVSLQITGFEFGVSNNVFHIPFVLKLEKSPEFSSDPLYLSLRNFTSIVWPALRLIGTEENIHRLFYLVNLLGRFAGLFGMVLVFRALEIDFKGIVLALWVACVTPWLQNYSMVGKHGMFIPYLTQSELSWISVLGSLVLLLKKRYTGAFILTGITFSINAFVGIWMLLIGAAEVLIDTRTSGKNLLPRPMIAFLVTSLPVIAWIGTAVAGSPGGESFSYLQYIRFYYPEHFLIEAAPWRAIARLCLILVAGIIASHYFRSAAYWIRIQLLCAAIFLIGCVVPYLIDSRFIFNLHLLRVDGIEQMIAILLLIGAALKLLADQASIRRRILGVVILFALASLDGGISTLMLLCTTALVGLITGGVRPARLSGLPDRVWTNINCIPVALFLGLFLLQASKNGLDYIDVLQLLSFLLAVALLSNVGRTRSLGQPRMAGIAVALFLVITSVGEINRTKSTIAEEDKSRLADGGWSDLVTWIRGSDLHGVFLVPITDQSSYFQLQARRRVWVDWKQGAAVMWDPSFYSRWASRYHEVAALSTPEQFVQYAKSKAIDYVIVKSDSRVCPTGSAVIRAEQNYILCRARA